MKVKRIFVNLTAHQLNDAQRRKALEFCKDIKEAEEILPKKLVQKLRQCPSDTDALLGMAIEVADTLTEYARDQDTRLYVHLPVGSPAFMWILHDFFPHAYCTAVFSHTRRVVEEIPQSDGSIVKKSVFKFEGFIFPDGGEPYE